MTETNENTVSPQSKRPIYLSPWLVAAAALALYGVTLNHWVTFGSLPLASQIMGWDWHPGPLPWRPDIHYQPLFLILTLPLRWLPADWRVMGLNVLTAVCAALTLAILARTVKLFSHDRTKEQRVRVVGKDALLSVRPAFLPAAFAVLLMGGQLTFWENAVVGTGEMMDLMVFAFLILCLLEYRISQRGWWLNLFALVYGAGTANNWGLIGFFPCFLLALIWIRRARFFKWRFVMRMIGWGFLGLLLYGLTPLLGALHHDGAFWGMLHGELAEQHLFLMRLPRYFVVIAAMSTLLPLFFAAIYWPSTEGDLIAGARELTRLLFRMLHVGFLAIGVLLFFDVKLSASPRHMGLGVIAGVPTFLTFYYLGALSVGYFSGYVLLVFGKDVEYRWGQATGLARLSNRMLTGLLWLAAIGLPAYLFWRDYPHMRDFDSPTVAQFGNEMAKSLPAKPAIVLADDPSRLYLAMGAVRRLGLTNPYTFIESRELVHREYLRYLADRYPSFRKDVVSPDKLPDEVSSRMIGDLLAHLAQRETVYYLHPSFGSYFEEVCMTPYRMGGYLHPFPTNVTTMLVLTQEAVVTNQFYWHTLETNLLNPLADFAKLGPDGLPERSGDAVRVANYYSQMLDCWGTDLQKAATELKLTPQAKSDMLKDAGRQFGEALRLNSNNLIARANQQYNAHLREVPPPPPLINTAQLAAEIGAWDVEMNLNGAADVPGLDIRIGGYFAQYGAYRQAAHLFLRCLELATNDPLAELDLAKTYVDMGILDPAITILNGIPEATGAFAEERARVEALAYAKQNNFAKADTLLTEARGKNPRDAEFARVMADFYRLMGYSVLRESNGDAAKEKDSVKWFQKSLAALDDELKLLSAPMEVTAHVAEIPRINLQRTEMQMMLKDYPAAILTATAMLRQNPQDPEPLLDRAISELQSGQLAAAKSDYAALEKLVPGSHMVYFGLAQVAEKQNDKTAEIHYDKLYLKYAPTNTAEFTNITQQLRKLEGR